MAKEPKTSQKSSLSSESTQTPSTQRMVLRARTTEPRKRSTRLRSESDEEARVVSAKKSKTRQKKSKKKQSKSFDSKKPKKPPTAFFYFLEDFRKEFQEQNPEIKSMRDVGKACGEKWKTMTYEEKVQYYDIATEKRAEFDTAMEEYLERKESGDYEATEDDSEFDEEGAKD